VKLGAIHWDVSDDVAAFSNDVTRRFGGTWNTYKGHGEPPARGERRTVDFWGGGGRGAPLPVHQGDEIVAWILGQQELFPVYIVIWYSWIWLPSLGWRPYSGYRGNHGPGSDAHVHVGF
jgi:hypothetical protein